MASTEIMTKTILEYMALSEEGKRYTEIFLYGLKLGMEQQKQPFYFLSDDNSKNA